MNKDFEKAALDYVHGRFRDGHFLKPEGSALLSEEQKTMFRRAHLFGHRARLILRVHEEAITLPPEQAWPRDMMSESKVWRDSFLKLKAEVADSELSDLLERCYEIGYRSAENGEIGYNTHTFGFASFTLNPNSQRIQR